jgi:CheY-like chemotaxis protein
VPKTLLAVDDSATMRKVLEITFSGEDYRIVTADSSSAALGKLADDPSVVLIDTVLGNDDGYALSKEVRKRNPSATIVLLSSRHNPYDPAKGRDAGADDFMDKPFDTQQMVEKVKKALLGRDAGPASTATYVGVAPAAAMGGAPGGPIPAPIPVIQPLAAAPARPAAPAPAPSPVPPVAVAKPPAGRSNTLMFGTSEATKAGATAPTAPTPRPAPVAAAAPAASAPRAVGASPNPSPNPPRVAPMATPAAAIQTAPPPGAAAASGGVAGKVNGQLSGKLGDLGLSAQQIEAVLALSREVVERVVWEVVPELAETLIKEEIARLTKA